MVRTGGDATLLSGLHELVNPQNVKHGINYEEIERGLINNGEINQQKDPNELFKSELADLAKTLGLDFNSPRSARDSSPRKANQQSSPLRTPLQSASRGDPYASARSGGTPARKSPLSSSVSYEYDDGSNDNNNGNNNDNDGGNGNGNGNNGSMRGGASIPSELSSLLGMSQDEYSTPRSARDDNYSSPRAMSASRTPIKSPVREEDEDEEDDEPVAPEPFPGFDYANRSPRKQTEFTRRTDEEYRHDQIKSVMNSMGGGDSKFISLDEANKEDEKTIMLEEIDSLRATLEEEEAKGIDKIPSVSQDDDYAVVENVLRRLRLKNDRARYTGLADEFLLWGAQCVEQLFDGKRAWFGKNPDLTGWSKEVQVKLRRMHHDTSTLVSGVMHDYNIGPGMRIMLELVPNFFMYARRRKQNYGKANIYSDGDIAQHMSSIRNIDD